MRSSLIVAASIAASLKLNDVEQDPSYPYGAQYRQKDGDFGWYVFDASTGGWGNTAYQTAAEADAASARAKAADVLAKKLGTGPSIETPEAD